MQSLEHQIWRSRLAISTKLKLYNMCILPIFQYGSDCWAISKTDARKIDALDQWCLRMLLGIKLMLTKQPNLTAIPCLGILCTWTTNAKWILLASPPADWRRQPGRPRFMWLSTIQQDLKQHHLTLPEATDLAQNRRHGAGAYCGGHLAAQLVWAYYAHGRQHRC